MEINFPPIEPGKPDAKEKFNTCKHRSPNPVTKTMSNCCSSWKKDGFMCFKFNLFPLNELTCKECEAYERSEIINGRNQPI
jgi:hypothetical protein